MYNLTYNLFEAHSNIFKTSIICRPYKALPAVMQYLPALLTYRDTICPFSVSPPPALLKLCSITV